MINNIKIAKNFTLNEFQCPCCKRVMVHPKLLSMLQKLRDLTKGPLYITSGYRCKSENRRVGGVPNSYHLYGMAADVYSKTVTLDNLLDLAAEVGFTGIGYYRFKGFLHLDIREKPYFFRR